VPRALLLLPRDRAEPVTERWRALATYWYRLRRFLLHNVLHADDTPHAIALGVGVATLVAFLPLVGFQTVIAIAIAALLRANKAVCVPIVWITNPATMVPIYYGCFALGRMIIPAPGASTEKEVDKLAELAAGASVFEPAFWIGMFRFLAGLGIELWVGCLVVGAVFGTVSYFLARWGVSTYRERRRRRALERALFRSKRRRGTVVRRSEPV
jgi:uncharacterized protein (DUF2062 family)